MAKYTRRSADAVNVVNRDGKELTVATIETDDTDWAEDIAGALAATTSQDGVVVLSDIQAACRNYQNGRISVAALHIVGNIENPPEIYIIWPPGHECLAGNAAADAGPRTRSPGIPAGRMRPDRYRQKV